MSEYSDQPIGPHVMGGMGRTWLADDPVIGDAVKLHNDHYWVASERRKTRLWELGYRAFLTRDGRPVLSPNGTHQLMVRERSLPARHPHIEGEVWRQAPNWIGVCGSVLLLGGAMYFDDLLTGWQKMGAIVCALLLWMVIAAVKGLQDAGVIPGAMYHDKRSSFTKLEPDADHEEESAGR